MGGSTVKILNPGTPSLPGRKACFPFSVCLHAQLAAVLTACDWFVMGLFSLYAVNISRANSMCILTLCKSMAWHAQTYIATLCIHRELPDWDLKEIWTLESRKCVGSDNLRNLEVWFSFLAVSDHDRRTNTSSSILPPWLYSWTDAPFRGVKTDSTGSNVSISFYCACACFACTYASEPLECLRPVGVRRGYQTPPNWNLKQLCAAVWELRTEPESSGRAANALKCWAISTNLPGETFFFLFLLQSVQRNSQG